LGPRPLPAEAAVSAAGASLPLAATEILASLASHRVLSTPQVRAIHFPERSPRWARMALARLAEAGLAAFVANLGAPGAPRRLWFVTERGARAALEAGLLAEMPRLLDAEAAAGPLQAHTLAVNDAAICFLGAARERGDECGPLAWRHEVAHRLGYGRRAGTLFADAVLTYLRLTESEVVVEQRFLELDRATLSVDRLAAELARYGRLLRAVGKQGELLWRSQYPSFPPLVCVLAGAGRAALERRRDAAVAILRGDPAFASAPGLSIRLCLAEDLAKRGPFAPIFTDARDPGEPLDWLLGGGEGG
ncbi:MAG TPA: replication-relaxation family protein, partial [Solirubrobacterales bacterium]|nr:replication-relaxation family protein [Solirubrobacterales bacterium]